MTVAAAWPQYIGKYPVPPTMLGKPRPPQPAPVIPLELDTPVRGVNHITLVVRDLDRAFRFYVNLLGCRPRARWARGAYLEAGSLWLCLELDARAGERQIDDSHVALSVGRGVSGPRPNHRSRGNDHLEGKSIRGRLAVPLGSRRTQARDSRGRPANPSGVLP